MKILMVNKFLHPKGGAETYMFKLGEYLLSQGHDVQYFGMEHEDRRVGNRVEAYSPFLDFHGGSGLAKLTYPIRTIYSVEARKQIRKVLEDFKPDVVHLHNFNYQLTPSVLLEIAAWRERADHACRIVFTAHDYNLICPNHMLMNPNTRQICENCLGGQFRHCVKGRCIHGSPWKSAVGAAEGYFWKWRGVYKVLDTIVCCSFFMKSRMDSNPVFRDKTVVIHNFINRAEWENTEKKDYVLYFGRFSQEKGVATLLDVCASLPDIPFVFAGSGPLENRTAEAANVTNVGFKTGQELEDLIREARFSVCPSEWYENCPLSVLESQTFGTPVLGADIGGIPELIRSGETGELFRPGDEADLREKIKALWNDRAKTEEYSRNCRDMQFEFDDIEQYGKKILRVYQG